MHAHLISWLQRLVYTFNHGLSLLETLTPLLVLKGIFRESIHPRMSARTVASLDSSFHVTKVSCSTLLLRAASTTIRKTMMKSLILNRIESPPLQ